MAESYGEPWEVGANYLIGGWWVRSAAETHPEHTMADLTQDEATCQRIVACVNALAGMEPDKLAGLIAAIGTANESYRLWTAEELPAGYVMGSQPSVLDAWRAVWAALGALLGQGEGAASLKLRPVQPMYDELLKENEDLRAQLTTMYREAKEEEERLGAELQAVALECIQTLAGLAIVRGERDSARLDADALRVMLGHVEVEWNKSEQRAAKLIAACRRGLESAPSHDSWIDIEDALGEYEAKP